jgi:hypothetical protein
MKRYGSDKLSVPTSPVLIHTTTLSDSTEVPQRGRKGNRLQEICTKEHGNGRTFSLDDGFGSGFDEDGAPILAPLVSSEQVEPPAECSECMRLREQASEMRAELCSTLQAFGELKVQHAELERAYIAREIERVNDETL